MNCVHQAFSNHMKHIGEKDYFDVFIEYRTRKEQTHGLTPQYTFAGIVPWLYRHMLFQHGLRSPNRIEMAMQRSYVTIEEYMQEATEQQKQIISLTPYWGVEVDTITLEPAIYCLLNEQHATFETTIPSWKGARILFAIQLLKEKDV